MALDWNTIIVALIGLAGAVVSGYVAITLKRVGKTVDVVHKITNSASLAQDKLNAELSLWKAAQTGNKADIQAAEAADKLYKENLAKQNTVDNQPL